MKIYCRNYDKFNAGAILELCKFDEELVKTDSPAEADMLVVTNYHELVVLRRRHGDQKFYFCVYPSPNEAQASDVEAENIFGIGQITSEADLKYLQEGVERYKAWAKKNPFRKLAQDVPGA